MLSSVLNSGQAIHVNVEIMRAFVRLRRLLGSHEDLARTLAALEKRYDAQFRAGFDAIRQLGESENRIVEFHGDSARRESGPICAET